MPTRALSLWLPKRASVPPLFKNRISPASSRALNSCALASERVAIFDPEQVLVPIVVSDRLTEAYVERITVANTNAQSYFEVDDVHAAHFGRGAERSAGYRLSLKSAEDMPAEYFHYWRHPNMISSI